MKRTGLLFGASMFATVLLTAATAWACVSGPAVKLSSATAKAGEEVTVSGTGWRFKLDPVTIRFNALDGAVLATAPVQAQEFKATVTVPPGTKPGDYVIVVSQHTPDGSLSQTPARALLTVVGPDGAKPVVGASLGPVEPGRPADLVRNDESVSAGTLALVALGVAGVGLFIAGMASLLAGRRAAPSPSPVASSR